MISLADKYQSELASYGQTEELRLRGATLLQNLRETDASQEVKKVEKKMATQERHQICQSIYDNVNRLNKIGRMVFENDPVHFALFESRWRV